MRSAELLPPGLASTAQARRFVATCVEEWGVEDPDRTAELLVSELAANAVLHTRTGFEVAVELEGQRLRVSVRDGSTVAPHRRPVDPTSPTGRGLLIVDSLADRWGVVTEDEGKTVWFELALDDTARRHRLQRTR